MARKRKVPAPNLNKIVEESENGGINNVDVAAPEDQSTVVAPNSTVDQSMSQNPMYSIMTNAQLNDLFHNKYIKDMQKLYEKVGCCGFLFLVWRWPRFPNVFFLLCRRITIPLSRHSRT